MTDLMGDPDREVDHPLMGELVKVCLDKEKPYWITGRMIKLTASGEIDLLAVDGRMHYAWPALVILPI